jgi:hypothetical protein
MASSREEEAAKRKRAEREKLLRDRDLQDVRYLLGRPEFKRFMGRWLNLCGLMTGGFIGSSETYFNEGKRWVGVKLVEEFTEADPDAYPRMMIELRTQEASDHA